MSRAKKHMPTCFFTNFCNFYSRFTTSSQSPSLSPPFRSMQSKSRHSFPPSSTVCPCHTWPLSGMCWYTSRRIPVFNRHKKIKARETCVTRQYSFFFKVSSLSLSHLATLRCTKLEHVIIISLQIQQSLFTWSLSDMCVCKSATLSRTLP